MTTEREANKAIRDLENAAGLAPKKQSKSKKENNKVKNSFFKQPWVLTIIVAASIVATVWATLFVRQTIENYNQNLINQGIQLEKDRNAALERELAARSKQAQQ